MKTKEQFTFLAIGFFLAQLGAGAAEEAKIQWRDARELTIEGKGWMDTKSFYDRLPARAEKLVRPPVWSLSLNSAGMNVRFVTDADTISVRWILRGTNLSMAHMPSSGVSGVDLYVRERGKWEWVGAGRPKGVTNEVAVTKGLGKKEREFVLYLPLYNGVSSVEIGVPAGAKLEGAPLRKNAKPIVFYGTSILQGGCASRPGLAHTSILARRLDWPVINLGFSGNAKSEQEVAQLLAELDPIFYVLDPLPNMTTETVKERMEPFIKTLRDKHPKTPIVLVENIHYPDGRFIQSRGEPIADKNTALQEIFQRLKKAGDKNLHYIPSRNLIGADGEGTVDGTHPNDLGFMRMADGIEPALRKVLRKSH